MPSKVPSNIISENILYEILCWVLQLTQHIQLQNTNEDLKGINYKMNANTKRWSQLLLFVQNKPWLAICTVAQVLPFT